MPESTWRTDFALAPSGGVLAVERVSFDDLLAGELRQRGFRRALAFSWMNSARTLLSELGKAAEYRRPAGQGSVASQR